MSAAEHEARELRIEARHVEAASPFAGAIGKDGNYFQAALRRAFVQFERDLLAALTTRPAPSAQWREGAEQLRDLRERARSVISGWRVHDSHFFDWLAENVGPENIEYLRFLHLNGERIAALVPPAPGTTVDREGEVERAAMALHEHEESWNDIDWEHVPSGTRNAFRSQARAVLATLSTPAPAAGAIAPAQDVGASE